MRTITLSDSQYTTLLDGLSEAFPEALELREYIRENAVETEAPAPGSLVASAIAKAREFLASLDGYTPPPRDASYHAEGVARAALVRARDLKSALWTVYQDGTIPEDVQASAQATMDDLRWCRETALANAVLTIGGTP